MYFGSLLTKIYGSNIGCRYARYGDVSPKIDVYAFGVVLYELISAKDAIVKINEVESRALVSLVIPHLSFKIYLLLSVSYRSFTGIGRRKTAPTCFMYRKRLLTTRSQYSCMFTS